MDKEILLENQALQIVRLGVGPFGNNVYIIKDLKGGKAILVDASAEAENILAVIGGDKLEAILQTHTHFDHIQALDTVRKASGAPVAIHPDEPEAASLKPETSLSDGQVVRLGDHEIEVLHTPGHTPGSVCFYLKPDICFCGDAVFPGGPGKTGSPEAFKLAVKSLEEKVYTLPDHVRLYPGHGEGTTVGDSRSKYEAFCARPRSSVPYGDVEWETS